MHETDKKPSGQGEDAAYARVYQSVFDGYLWRAYIEWLVAGKPRKR